MSGLMDTFLLVVAYLGTVRLVRVSARYRFAGIALLNVVAMTLLLASGLGPRLGAAVAAGYVVLVLSMYVTMRGFARRPGRLALVAFLSPIAVLVLVKYGQGLWAPVLDALIAGAWAPSAGVFLGLSFVCFRLVYVVLEVRNGLVETPSPDRYLAFAFFLPTLPVGPINTYGSFERSLVEPDPDAVPPLRCLARIGIGAAKYLFLGSIFGKLGYHGLLLDGYPHGLMDAAVAVAAYYAFLYCNFSGFCDMAIGASGLVGIAVPENFDRPMTARNVRELWTRWHMTLGTFMRDLVFTPLSLALARRWGPRHVPQAVGAAILIVFALIGIWHGVGWSFLLFGLCHGIAVCANHYYGLWLRARLGSRMDDYLRSRWIRFCGQVLTFWFMALTLCCIALDIGEIAEVISRLRPGF